MTIRALTMTTAGAAAAAGACPTDMRLISQMPLASSTFYQAVISLRDRISNSLSGQSPSVKWCSHDGTVWRTDLLQ